MTSPPITLNTPVSAAQKQYAHMDPFGKKQGAHDRGVSTSTVKGGGKYAVNSNGECKAGGTVLPGGKRVKLVRRTAPASAAFGARERDKKQAGSKHKRNGVFAAGGRGKKATLQDAYGGWCG